MVDTASHGALGFVTSCANCATPASLMATLVLIAAVVIVATLWERRQIARAVR